MEKSKNNQKSLKQTPLDFSAGFASFEKFNERLNFIIMALLFLMMFLIVGDLFGRFFFKPIQGTLEITEIILVFLVFPSLAHTEIKGMHIRAQMLVFKFPEKVQVILDMVAYVLGVVFFTFMGWGSTLTALESLAVLQVSEGAEIPIYPAKFAIPVGCLLIVIVFLKKLIGGIRQLAKDRS